MRRSKTPSASTQQTFSQIATEFTRDVRERFATAGRKSPEEQLRAPLTSLLKGLADLRRVRLTLVDETPLDDNSAIPDLSAYDTGVLAGHVELKAPGTGVDVVAFSGHNKKQWANFRSLPNCLYTDGNAFALYRSGELAGEICEFVSNIKDHRSAETGAASADALELLLVDFLSWQPTAPSSAKALADALAPLCRYLRNEVLDAVSRSLPPILQVKQDWEQVLQQDSSNEVFADHYAQTVTFALLLARARSPHAALTLTTATVGLDAQHAVLSKTLLLLTDAGVQKVLRVPLDVLLRILNAVDVAKVTATKKDFWLYFYEDFLASYDPRLRENAGVYYTPHQVVSCQINLIHDILVHLFATPDGLAGDEVVMLDPAVGTGTYAVGMVSKVAEWVAAQRGKGAVGAAVTRLAQHFYGLELLVGPYAVAQQRLAQAVSDAGGKLPSNGLNIYRADTLSDPYATPPTLTPFFRAISEEQAKAIALKRKKRVVVCVGNPPYEYHLGKDDAGKKNWVRYGGGEKGFLPPLLDVFLQSASGWSAGLHGKTLHNLYIYFWRWALWKVLEQQQNSKGIICFICPNSFIAGPAYAGMREYMRRLCTHVWVIDIGGDSRLDGSDSNIFPIRTGVAICIAVRDAARKDPEVPAEVLAVEVCGTTAEKLDALGRATDLGSFAWAAASQEWTSPFAAKRATVYGEWPQVTDLFPWQEGGMQIKRTWPAHPSKAVLRRRWELLASSNARQRKRLFVETRDNKITDVKVDSLTGKKLTPVAKLTPADGPARLAPYSYRCLDNQHVVCDARVVDYQRAQLWRSQGPSQIYFGSKLTMAIGDGPAIMACAYVPDMDFFNNRGARDIIPLYRDSAATQPNVSPSVLRGLSQLFGRRVSAEMFAAYVYGVLNPRNFIAQNREDVSRTRELRVPVTADAELFSAFAGLGQKLVWLHTYGERSLGRKARRGIPRGVARWTHSLSGMPNDFRYDADAQILHIEDGQVSPVSPDVWGYEVSGYHVVKKWLGYRMRERRGRTKPLDRVTLSKWPAPLMTQLLELLWVLEHTVTLEQSHAAMYAALLAGPTVTCKEWLAETPDVMSKAADKGGQRELF
jgi:hypothetical protein